MTKLFILLVLVIVFTGCHKSDNDKGTPGCVVEKIIDFSKSSTCNDIRVDEYIFQENTVYAFEPGTCGADMTTGIINSECKILGHLGGISGNTKINGENFSNATFIKTIWKK